MNGEWEVVCSLSNDDIINDLGWLH